MKYKYKAKKADGTEYENTHEAKDKFALYRDVRAEGGTVVSVKEGSSGGIDWKKLAKTSLGGVKLYHKITLARNLSSMISAGLSMERALNVMERQSKEDSLKNLYRDLAQSISEGKTLSEAMGNHKKVFSSLFISMVRAGEESGALADSLSIVGTELEQAYELKRKVRGALMYPMVVMFAMLIVATLMLTYVVPTLASTFREMNVDLPKMTIFIMTVSDILSQYFLIVAVSVVVFITALFYASKTVSGKKCFHWLILRIPIVGMLVKEVNSARTARTLSSLLKAGVDITTAFQITQDVVQNVYFKAVIVKAGDAVTRGNPTSLVFREAEHLYPPLVSEMMAVGEETGKLPAMLERIALFYESEVTEKTKNMSTIIEPFLMLFIGGGVGFFAVAMIQPIYSLSSAI